MSIFTPGERSAFQQFQEKKWRQKRLQDRKDRKVFKRNMKLLFYTIVAVSIVYFSIIGYERWQFRHDSKKIAAIVVNKKSDSYRVNEMGNEYVNHYYLSYKYRVNNKWYRTMVEVRYDEEYEYFEFRPKVGDTIEVTYLPSNPKKSELVKLK